MRKNKKGVYEVIVLMIVFVMVLVLKSPLWALEINEVMVTDVTPGSFCVVWSAGESAEGNIEVYQDTAGSYPVASYNVINTPCQDTEICEGAAAKGIIKIKVEGLCKNTAYYFRLSYTGLSDPEQTLIYPADDSLLEVITEDEARLSKEEDSNEVRLHNNLLIHSFYAKDKISPAEDTLVAAKVEGASYPLSAYVGEGAASPYCVFDLHNLFDQIAHGTLEASGGSEIIFYHYKGEEQPAIRKFFLPLELPEAEPIAPVGVSQEITLDEGLNYISFQVDPQNSAEIHSALSGKYNELWTFEEGVWIDLTGNDAYVFHPNQGYLITTKEQIVLTAAGGRRLDPIPLREGLNIVGYRSEAALPVEEAMAPLVGKYTCIWGYSEGSWRSYDPRLQAVLNTLTEIVPGKSYYIEVKEAGISW